MKKYDIIVIGGDAAGMSAASQARRINSRLSITVLEKGRHVSYAACGLPYFIADEVTESENLIAIDVNEFIAKRNIEIRMNTEVLSVDFSGKIVTAQSSGETIQLSYDILVIATGARAIVPPIEGIETPGIFYLRNLDHGIQIKDYIARRGPGSGIIIGGGFIGLEMAEALRKKSIDVTIIEKFNSVAMPLSPEIREIIARTLHDNRVKVHTSAAIHKIEKTGDGISVITDGEVHRADFVIASAGILPATDFLRGSGILMNDRGAIVVDEKSMTNIPGVFAAGDCATVKNLITGNDVYFPLGTIANKQGRVAGLQAAGVAGEVFRGTVGSQLVKVFELEVGKTGLNSEDAARNEIRADSATVLWRSRASYYPSSRDLTINLTINADTGELIGGEVAGTDGAALRTNVIAAAVTARMKIEDVAYLDLGYAPPFSPVWDPVNAAAQKLSKRKHG
ncbi:MAG TPA: FAD-dependent oxidoreductase [Spirochaetota bacterium]|nr:FAD-dependent oxidoreductase [Spirochaetota bacterium]HPC40421.1 FAD-dependent oxidoreductase [Spirochaetota bacterium]HPL18112.1 FAD-dependent oxidoreductase [Spirochaetota bacterium]HQF06488.1 FAD-dependent oxidoreductase [Spirochaetota bacterium]HQH98073.1 FAD-dependent oxidoreductase [Spirochaetota bacterium]